MSQSIVLAMCEKHKVARSEFFGNCRLKRVVKCRVAAMKALREAGFNKAACARLMGRSRWTAYYWLTPGFAQERKKQMLARKAWKRCRNGRPSSDIVPVDQAHT